MPRTLQFQTNTGNTIVLLDEKTIWINTPVTYAPEVQFEFNASNVGGVFGFPQLLYTATGTAWITEAQATDLGAIKAKLETLLLNRDPAEPAYITVDWNISEIQEDGTQQRPTAAGGSSTPTADGFSFNPKFGMLPTEWRVEPYPSGHLLSHPFRFTFTLEEVLILT